MELKKDGLPSAVRPVLPPRRTDWMVRNTIDNLILLKSRGQMVYHGPLGDDSHTMIKYFESNGAPRCPKDKNPAEYMLEPIGAPRGDCQEPRTAGPTG